MRHVNAKKAEIVYKMMGEIFLQERVRQGKSTRILADEYELQRSMISRIERGVNEPKLSSILSMCEALGIKPSRLFTLLEKRLPKEYTLMEQ